MDSRLRGNDEESDMQTKTTFKPFYLMKRVQNP